MIYDIRGIKLEVKGNRLYFTKGSESFLSLPYDFTVNGKASSFSSIDFGAEGIKLVGDTDRLDIRIFDDCLTLAYKKRFDVKTEIYDVVAFSGGIELYGFDRAFTPQARNNSHRNLDWFSHFPDISSNGYFTPSLLQVSIGSPDGWVGIGLLDIPDTKLCKLREDMTFLLQSSGGNITVDEGMEFAAPEVVIYFPRDEWESISDFRKKLIDFKKYTPKKPKFDKLPEWWRRPMVCIYGDQLIDECVGQGIDEKWVSDIVDAAESDFGLGGFNLVIDDSWQLPHSMIPVVDTKRFPDLRGFIERMHKRGHRVLLWMTPMMEKITNGYTTRAQELGLITDYACPSPYYNDFPGTYYIDYTADNAEKFIREMVRYLFGEMDGELHADGVKLDFLGNHRDPSLTKTYSHPERGIGMREMYRFYEMFYTEAKRINPEVIIDATVGDPRFEDFVDFNRMHDTHSGNLEKRLRVRASALACPDLVIDSDGALMYSQWVKGHYIDAAIYGIPANYYTRKYQDARTIPGDLSYEAKKLAPTIYKEMPKEVKRQLGNLFELVKHRPCGTVTEWDRGFILKDGERVNGISIGEHTVVYYPTEQNGLGYIFSFLEEAVEIPLFDRKFGDFKGELMNNNIQIDYARGRVILHMKPGEVCTFRDIDDGTSIDKTFLNKSSISVETDMNYVN